MVLMVIFIIKWDTERGRERGRERERGDEGVRQKEMEGEKET